VNEPVEFLDLDDVLGLAVTLFGDPLPVRDIGLLGSAAARPQTTAFGDDAYPDIWTKAAALLHSIVKNHALVDGNKRLGWLATGRRLPRVPPQHLRVRGRQRQPLRGGHGHPGASRCQPVR
jgi:hypothetical protein